MSMEKLDTYVSDLADWSIKFAPRLILAVVILFAGFWLARKVSHLTQAALEKAKIAAEISSFLNSIIDIGLKIVVILMVATVVGFEISSLVAILAATGFAIGLALQGFLGNFAAGITIVFFKPYKVGDWVEISGKFGKVESIQIFSTSIITPGQKTLIIPNGQVTDNIITNFSTKGLIRLELQVTMPYEESFSNVKSIILDVLKKIPNVEQSIDPLVGIENYDTHNIVVAVRPFVEPDYYWDVTFEVYEKIKHAFGTHGIKVAYSEGVELGPIGE